MSAPFGIDALVVLQRSDVDHLAANAERYSERFADLPLLFIDPGILDAALQAGLKNYELRKLDVSRDLSALAYAQALHCAANIDLALTEKRRALWGSGASGTEGDFHGWDLGLLYLTLQRAYTQQALGRVMGRTFPERRLGLLRPANPAFFNWDSMLACDIVAADAGRWSVVEGYAQGRHWNPALLDLCFDFDGVRAQVQAGQADCVSHLATCFYDAGRFADAISERFASNIDLPGLYCDVPVRRTGAPLLRLLGDAHFDADCSAYRERARAVFMRQLAPLIPSRPALIEQATAFARRSHLQAVNFVGLRRALAGSRPHFVVADHDVGCTGPLFSVAAELGSPITVLPHSNYPTSLMPHARNVTVIERDGVGVPVRTVLGQPVATRGVGFRPPIAAVARREPRRLCLLPNTMLAEGLSYVELFALIGLYPALAALCARHGWDLSVRLKPSSPALNVVASALRMPPGYFMRTMAQPIETLAAETDLCVAFGEPSTATLSFFDAAAYVVHVSEQDWPADYVITTPLKGEVMPSMRCAEVLGFLDALMREPARYAERQQAQAAAYARRRANAHASIFPPGRLGASASAQPVPAEPVSVPPIRPGA